MQPSNRRTVWAGVVVLFCGRMWAMSLTAVQRIPRPGRERNKLYSYNILAWALQLRKLPEFPQHLLPAFIHWHLDKISIFNCP